MALGAPRKLLVAPWCAERILFDEDGILVVDKPAGIPVHGGREELRESVVDRLADYRGAGAYLGVHSRLDLGTSGALLFTTDPEKNREVAAAFDSGSLRRKYLGIVEHCKGRRLSSRGTIRLSLEHDGVRSRVVRTGKLAVTHYQVLEQVGERCLVEFELETGRTHQIRASMAYLGAPLFGDALYGGALAPRVCLHAHGLEGAPLNRQISAGLPSEFRELLEFGVLPPCRPDRIGRRVRDALLLRGPVLALRDCARLVDDVADLLPGVTADTYGDQVAIRTAPELEETSILEVERQLQAYGFSRLEEATAEGNRYLWVSEYGQRYPFDLGRIRGGGFPLELAELRRRLTSMIRPGRVLDLFCGGGSLSLAMAARGASTVCVDISRAAIEQARVGIQSAVGGLAEGARNEFWQVDARSYLSRAQKRGEKFELVLLDPPAKSTRSRPSLRIPEDYESLVIGAVSLLTETGMLAFVARHAGAQRSGGRGWLEALVGQAGFALEKGETVGAGSDFRNDPPVTISLLRVRRLGSAPGR